MVSLMTLEGVEVVVFVKMADVEEQAAKVKGSLKFNLGGQQGQGRPDRPKS